MMFKNLMMFKKFLETEAPYKNTCAVQCL